MNEKTQTPATNSNRATSGVGTQTMDRITESAHNSIDAASKAAHPTIERAASGAHKAVESADQMAHHAAEAIDRVGIKGEELVKASTSYMREHPLITLGLAVSVGFVFSRLLASRKG